MPMNPRLLRPLASGAFSPKQISGLVGWWDADDASTVTLSGSLATQWNDKSGLGNNVTAAAGQEPTYEPLAQAGKGGLNWGSTQGNNKGFRINPLSTAITGRDVFVVCDWNAGATSTEYAGIFAHGTQLGLNNSGTGFYNVGFSRFSINGAASSTTALPALSAVNVLRGTLAADSTNTALTIGTWGGFTTRGWPGRIYEIIYYDRELSDAEAARVRQYLNSKWKIDAPPAYADADVNAYITAVEAADGLTLDEAVRDAYNDFIVGCKSDGIWDAIKASCILAGARTLAGALVPLVGTAPTNNNFTASDYNRETGLVGDGSTTYLDSNRAGDADPQDNFHGSVYGTITTGTGASLKILMGATGNSTKAIGLFHYASQFFFNNRRAAAANSSVSQALANGFVGASRSSSASSDGRAGGTTTTFAHASTTPGSEEIAVFANNNQGSVETFSDARLAFYSIGESLDLAALETRVSALITAIGNAL